MQHAWAHSQAVPLDLGTSIYYGGPYLHFLKKLFCDRRFRCFFTSPNNLTWGDPPIPPIILDDLGGYF